MRKILWGALCMCAPATFGQEVSGSVTDKHSGEGVPYASVYFIDAQLGSTTDSSGHFHIHADLPEVARVRVSASGYTMLIETIETHKELHFVLEPTHLELPDVTVSSPASTLQRENAMYIETRKLEELNAIPGRMGEAISKMPGVYQSTNGTGVSKPVIRGLQGTRVVTMLNGLRIENQQWGGDHGMAVSSMGIGTVEVVKGPASLAYGADALGGVIYFADAPFARQNTQEIVVNTQLESVTMSHFSTLDYRFARKNIRFNVSGLMSNYADYQLPNGKYAKDSRFKENGAKLAFGWNRKKWMMDLRYTYTGSRVGIPGHSHDSIPDLLDFQSDEQSREQTIPAQVLGNHFASLTNKWFLRKGMITLLLGNTYNRLQEFEEKFTIPGLDMTANNSVYNLKWSGKLSPKWDMVVGAQGGYLMNRNAPKAEEQLIPGYNQTDNGAYVIAYFGTGNWKLQGGVRYDFRILEVLDHPALGTFTRQYQSFNGSLGTVYHKGKHTLRFNVSTGFRGPHVSELVSDGVHHGTMRYEIGDPDLKAERGNQFDLVYEISGEHLEVIINPFFNYMQDYIVINPLDSVIDGLPVYKYQQVPQALLYGTDFGVHFHPHFAHWLHLEASTSVLWGETGTGDPLPLIPQSRIRGSAQFMLESLFKTKFCIKDIVVQYNYLFDQNRVTPYETPTKAYQLLDLGVNMLGRWKTPLEFGIGVKNLFNENYIDHLSRLKNIGLSQPGRSFYVRIGYTIKSNIK